MALHTSGYGGGLDAWTQGAQLSGPPSAYGAGVDLLFDLYHGTGQIANTIAVEDPIGTPERPIRRRVSLLDRRSMTLVRVIWADESTGAYAFNYLPTDVPFMVIADDFAGVYNAVIADWIYAT